MLQKVDTHTQRLLDLADFIEGLEPERFSMRQWGQKSEPRCICGWFLFNEDYINKDDWKEAADRLGIDHALASVLFSPETDWSTYQAAAILRELAVSGEVECLKWRGSIATQS